MKRGFLISLFSLVLLVIFAGNARATYIWPHDGYNSGTGSCSNCHLSSVPSNQDLNKGGNITQICYSCHTGSGSKYNVETGMINMAYPSSAGGFQLYQTSKTVTSIHNVDKTYAKVPGSNLTNFALNCDSCHNPHGSPNFRLLRSTINNNNIAVKADIVTGADGSEKVYYLSGIDVYCASCHEKLDNTTNNTLYLGVHRHKIGFDPLKSPKEYGYKVNQSLPLELNEITYTNNSNPDTLSCITCHFAHSTKAIYDTNPRSPYIGKSSLLRRDRSGICVNCHQVYG